MRRMGKLIGGTFFTTVALGFTADLLQLNARSLGRGFFWPIFLGGAGASIFLARIKFPRLVLPLLLLICTIGWLAGHHAYNATSLQVPVALKKRDIFDCLGMLKTSMRVSFEYRRPLLAMLECVDRVLPVVKEPDLFATLAIVSFSGSGFVEYALAGHVPILHYRDSSGDTVPLAMRQYPLGLLPGGGYESACTAYAAGDLFLLVSDGMTEVFNEKDEEFGLTGLQQVLTKHAVEPLPELCGLIMGEVKRHGPQQDDQSVLLLRVRE